MSFNVKSRASSTSRRDGERLSEPILAREVVKLDTVSTRESISITGLETNRCMCYLGGGIISVQRINAAHTNTNRAVGPEYLFLGK